VGQFANAVNRQRVATIDGYGSIIVNYTPTGVILSNFEPNPNPPPIAPASWSAAMGPREGRRFGIGRTSNTEHPSHPKRHLNSEDAKARS